MSEIQGKSLSHMPSGGVVIYGFNERNGGWPELTYVNPVGRVFTRCADSGEYIDLGYVNGINRVSSFEMWKRKMGLQED